MAVRFSWTVQEADGDAVVGANVDLYYYGGAKYIDMIDNGDGSYYCNVTASGKYTVYIGGVAQDEGTGIWIPADDTPTAAGLAAKADKVTGATNGNLAALDTNGNLTDSGYDQSDFLQATHANANGSGGSATPATNKVHNAAAVGVADAGGLLTAADVEAALAEIMGKIGTMDFANSSFISDMTTITGALAALNNQVYDLYLRGGDTANQTSHKAYFIYTFSGNTAAASYAAIGNLAGSATTEGIGMPGSGSVTGVYLSYETYSNIAVVPVRVYLNSTLLMEIGTNGVGNNGLNAKFGAGLIPITEWPGTSYKVSFTSAGGASYLTNPIVTLEVTFIG